MSGLTPSPPFSRLVLELLEGYFPFVVTDVLLPRLPSIPRRMALGASGVVCHLLVSIQDSAHYRRERELTSAPRARSMTLWVRRVMVLSNSWNFDHKLIGNCNGGPHDGRRNITKRGRIKILSKSFNFQNTNNFKGPFPWVLCCCLRLRMSATSAVLIELCRVSTNSSLSSLAC